MADDTIDEGTHDTAAADSIRSRRHLLAAAGGALGAALVGSLGTASSADATQGANTVTGLNNSETAVTTFTNITTGNGDGVRGVGHGTGTGVTAKGGATSGTGMVGTGGAPSGIGVQGNGDGGGGGLAGVGGDSSGMGVQGVGGSPNGTGVIATGTGTGHGIRAFGGPTNGSGIQASGSGTSGSGVEAFASGLGPAVHAAAALGDAVLARTTDPESTGVAIRAVCLTNRPVGSFQGDGAQLALFAVSSARPAPAGDSTTHDRGEILSDGTGNLWHCVASGTPGTWRQVSGANTSGAFHVLPSPVRVYDSRPGTAPGTGPKTPLVANTARTLDATINGSGVPVGATAVQVNLLLVNAVSGNGNFTIWANGVAKPLANNMVWGGTDGRHSSLASTALDATGKCQVLSSLATDFVLDIVGYYL